MKFRFVMASVALVALSACQSTKEAPNMSRIGVDVSWAGIKACSPGSPAFKLANVPADTKVLAFKMVDLDAATFNHGGGKVSYAGNNDIPAGAFSYVGPCPPIGAHHYEWTVQALDGKEETVLGKGVSTTEFPPK